MEPGKNLVDETLSLKHLKDFLDELKGSDIEASKNWFDIGYEVYYRKSLMIRAKRVLDSQKIKNSLEIAATDVFVEKAQKQISKRAILLLYFGIGVSLATLIIASGAAWFLSTIKINEDLDAYKFVLYLIRSLTIGGLIFSMCYFLATIARALFHESLSLLNKRHALRFGRLFVYLKESTKIEDLENAFNWNKEYDTAFKSIDTSMIKTPVSKILEILPDIVKSAIDSYKNNPKSILQEKTSKPDPDKSAQI